MAPSAHTAKMTPTGLIFKLTAAILSFRRTNPKCVSVSEMTFVFYRDKDCDMAIYSLNSKDKFIQFHVVHWDLIIKYNGITIEKHADRRYESAD